MIAYYRKESGTWVDYYPIQNSKGSVVKLMTNGTANTPSLEPQLIEEVEYDPYGTATVHVGGGQQPTSSKGNPYLFQGRRHDPETGFYYFRNRYLDTTLGRFLTNDPIGAWGDAANDGNALAFVGNNPSTNLDPSGLTTIGGKGPAPAKSGGGFGLPIGALGANMPMEPGGPTYTGRNGEALPPGIMASQGNRGDRPCASYPEPLIPELLGLDVHQGSKTFLDGTVVRGLAVGKGSTEFIPGSESIELPGDERIDAEIFWREADLPGGSTAAVVAGAHHMWIRLPGIEVGLGEGDGDVPGEGDSDVYGGIGAVDHTGQGNKDGARSIRVSVIRWRIYHELRLRPIDRTCGPTYHCNTFVWNAVGRSGGNVSDAKNRYAKEAKGAVKYISTGFFLFR